METENEWKLLSINVTETKCYLPVVLLFGQNSQTQTSDLTDDMREGKRKKVKTHDRSDLTDDMREKDQRSKLLDTEI